MRKVNLVGSIALADRRRNSHGVERTRLNDGDGSVRIRNELGLVRGSERRRQDRRGRRLRLNRLQQPQLRNERYQDFQLFHDRHSFAIDPRRGPVSEKPAPPSARVSNGIEKQSAAGYSAFTSFAGITDLRSSTFPAGPIILTATEAG
jgi:hypothetical protein